MIKNTFGRWTEYLTEIRQPNLNGMKVNTTTNEQKWFGRSTKYSTQLSTKQEQNQSKHNNQRTKTLSAVRRSIQRNFVNQTRKETK
jgi:hypothetical protein